MNYLQKHNEFDTVEAGLVELEKAVGIRNQMGGALYYNITHDDCVEIGKKIIDLAASMSEEEKKKVYEQVSKLTSHS